MPRRLFRRLFAVILTLCVTHGLVLAQEADAPEPAIAMRYWIDADASATAEQVAALPASDWQAVQQSSFKLPDGALWLRIQLPAVQPPDARYLLLDSSAFTDRASLYQLRGADWVGQHAGDHIAVAQWPMPDRSPVFALDPNDGTQAVLLRLENRPTPLSVHLAVVDHDELQQRRSWTLLLVGGYLGFGLLVMFLGWVHARLYRDRAFVAYVVYVGCMLSFQAAFTGIGGMFFWPHWAWFNNAAPALFMLWLTASGLWFVREVCAISRHHRGLDRFVIGWSFFGLLFPAVYLALENPTVLTTLNLYGLLSVLLSIGLCLWAWRQGERYAGWLVLGFLPVHLGYPFPALRAAGLLADSWGAQYAVLIGSAIEIPLLLYILHHRAQHFSENRARLRALDHTDPLTGLTVVPVLKLRLRDAIRRARRYGHHCQLMLVELANHADLRLRLGQEAADRALVVAAGRLSRIVRDVDTVCRVTDRRFAVLVEGPANNEQLRLLAQHMVAKGLEPGSLLPEDTALRFRIATLVLPDALPPASEEDERLEARRALERLHQALDAPAEPAQRPVLHLSQPSPA